MSARLRTPTGRPASSITGAALKPLSINRLIASRTEAFSWIDTGFGVMSSAAVPASSLGGFIAFTFIATDMRFLLQLQSYVCHHRQTDEAENNANDMP